MGQHGDPSGRDFGEFLVLFFPAWWAWVNLMVLAHSAISKLTKPRPVPSSA